jgi:hypothetical protein
MTAKELLKSQEIVVDLQKGVEKRQVKLSKPNRNVVSLALSAAMGGDVLSSTEVVIKNCYVGGTLTKDEILDEVNPEWLFAIHQIVGQIIGSATAKIKN